MKTGLRALMTAPVDDVESAETASDAAALLRDLLRVEAQVSALFERTSRRARPGGSVAERPAPYATGLRGVTLHEAARRALLAAGAPLHVKDLGARIKAAGWRHPRSARPRPDQIEFQLAARLPRHPDLFRRVAPNTFALAEWGETAPSAGAKPRLKAIRGRGPKLARRVAEQPDLVFGEEPRWRSS